MVDGTAVDWLSACGAEGLDPGEVRLVLGRYRAYQGYYAGGRRGTPLPLASWFNWYRMEAESEHGEKAPPPSGCSVDDDARNRGAIQKPQAFLRVLSQLDAMETPP